MTGLVVVARVLELHAAGLSNGEIARAIGRTKGDVRWIRRNAAKAEIAVGTDALVARGALMVLDAEIAASGDGDE